MHLFDFLSLSDNGSTMDLPWIKAFMDRYRHNRRNEADYIQADWSNGLYRPSEAEIERAALLAWEGHLTSVKYMIIKNISITDIPRDYMERLASVVTGLVHIQMMDHTDQLGSILANIKCTRLFLCNMELSEAETRALVTAMKDRVQCVRMGHVTMDIEELTKYDGQGCCSWLQAGRMRIGYWERLRRWAADKGWRVTIDVFDGLVMERMSWNVIGLIPGPDTCDRQDLRQELNWWHYSHK